MKKKILTLSILSLICITAFVKPDERAFFSATGTAAVENWHQQLTVQAALWTATPSPTPIITPEPTKVYPVMTFGHFEQDGETDNGSEPIEWLVLDEDQDSRFLISKYVLNAGQYLPYYFPITWEDSAPREWLNGEFFEISFSDEEKEKILLTDVHTPDNPRYGIRGGNDTEDHLFLMSIDEVEKYFPDPAAMRAFPTKFAENQGAYADPKSGANNWWLRSPGGDPRWVSYVNVDNSIVLFGRDDFYWYHGFRPAMRIRK